MSIFTVLHLFSGSGGLAKGFHDVGFTSAGNIDMDPRACIDLRNLCGTAAIEADIGAMGPADLLALVPECPDVAASSSPCVGFSGCLPEATSKTAKYQDFNSLALHGVWLLLEAWKGAKTGRKVPGMIVFENVPRIMTRGKKLLEHLVGLLHAEGYAVDMRTHDCGELGRGLAQKRRRFLLVARHMPTVTDFLRKPPAYSPLAIREVLWQLAPPRPGGPDHMHRLPSLSAKHWLRLACICAGGDWRDLPAEVWIYHCESADLEAVTGIRWNHCVGRHDGKLGVLDWERPSKTIIGKARVCNTWNSVADPRVDTADVQVHWPKDKHGGRPDCYGMSDETCPSGTIRGAETIYSSKASTPDPRVGSVDARLIRPQRSDAYGVQGADQPSGTIVGHHQHDNVAGSVADARVAVELAHIPQRGTMGVQAADEPADVVRGNHSIRQAPGAVEDPRVDHSDAKPGKRPRKPAAARAAKPAKPSLPRLYNERGWPVATHYLVKLDDGRLVLYGPPVDFTDNRPRADLVIVALDGTLHRPFTDAELALLMGFPLGYVFCGPSSCTKTKEGEPLKTGRRKRIGNAVPPPTAYAIAQECKATLIASANGGFRLATGDVWVQPDAGAIAA